MKKQMISAALAALIAASALPISACAATAADQSTPKEPVLNRTDHMKYMNGYADGTFRPDASITRAEAVKLIAELLTDKDVQGDYVFADIKQGAWYYDAVNILTGYSLVSGYADGTFRPDASITRAEFVTILSRFPHTDIGVDRDFSDVPATHWAYSAVQTALAQNWVGGYADGTFRPDDLITRAEAVTMLGRVLGRQADKAVAASAEGIRIMPDVPDTHWAYYAMLEATVAHQYESKDGVETWTDFTRETTVLAPGWHNIEGELYHVNADQLFDRNTAVDGLELDRNGRYTTGSEKLDKQLTEAVRQALKGDSQDQLGNLRVVYEYAKNTFGYLGVGEVDTSKAGWDITQAENMLETKKGNCYSWASAFTHLARKVGYPAKAIVGKGVSPKGNESVHAWTEITIDGVPYTFDPQIESVYAARYGEKYDLFMKKYGEAEWGYKADENQSGGEAQEPEADKELDALMDKIYKGAEYGGMLGRTPLYPGMGGDNSRSLSWFLGTDDLDIEAGLASESMITSQAHSVVLARFKDGTDMEQAKKTVKEKADPRKWICVGVSEKNVLVDAVGNVLVLIMDEENAQTYLKNFKAALS
ncbi:S-layer homology domain-containing protein [Agathobaculum sp.]|uniref:S-layer homology domain-containing protein n=1 Tax=Agathobaculum sp. TaxID=2048138 RepID=UPI002A82C1B7|nr:S-layer homology domain-containing protein [Agathobaculum sp.]MDY3619137.1 S-layer homology domain-containing protein [Agathobaculum sp.]